MQGKDNWPFAFTVTQEIELFEDGLQITMQIKNDDKRTMPTGFGWHPFFPRHDGVELQFLAQQVVLNDESMLPQQIESIPEKWDFTKQKQLAEPQLDNCFVNWQRRASIYWPKKNLTLSLTASEMLKHLVVMTPAAPLNYFFAVEPVSHINNAINSHDPKEQGIYALANGESITGWMRLKVKSLSQIDSH